MGFSLRDQTIKQLRDEIAALKAERDEAQEQLRLTMISDHTNEAEANDLRDRLDAAYAVLRLPDSTNDGGPADLAAELRTLLHNHRVEVEDVERERDEAQANCAAFCGENERLTKELDRLAQLADRHAAKADEWQRACPQSSVCPKCGFQTVHRYPEPPGAGELVLVREIERLRALLREALGVIQQHAIHGVYAGDAEVIARLKTALEGRDALAR